MGVALVTSLGSKIKTNKLLVGKSWGLLKDSNYVFPDHSYVKYIDFHNSTQFCKVLSVTVDNR